MNGPSKPTFGGGDITILLLGETGVGKSTWINGFANFLQFESLDEAEQNQTLCLIPSSFTITDDNYEERLISTGQDENEVTEAGQSATQQPQSYLFPRDGHIVRLIDTPGIGDVRGVEQDKKNFEMVLDHISHLEELHAICILLKPNNARLNIMFSFCIKELLTHLHKDACRNIVFCFTNSRSTFYRPGDTLPALRKLLEENKDVDIPLNQSTLYCMDNEAIRFLYALKSGIQFTSDERKNYVASWEKSVDEVSRLLKHASQEQPHSIYNTLSLNNARQTILALGSPMAEVTRNIQTNIVSYNEEKERLNTSQQNKEELSRNLVTQEYYIKMIPLNEPRTVCTSVTCVEFVEVGRQKETCYKTHCHESCGTGKQKHFKIANKVGHKNLRKCSAFDKAGLCRTCGCSWKTHMKITYETIMEMREITDLAKQIEIMNAETAIKKIEKYMEGLDDLINELCQEQKEITNASIEFARFLKSNAITPYNDSMDAYLAHFINQEQNKVEQGADPKVLNGMKQMRLDYQKQMELLEEAMQKGSNDTPVTPEDLHECIENLYRLKHSGKNLMAMMENSQKSAASNYTEKRIERNESFTAVTTTTKTNKTEKKINKLLGIFKTFSNTSIKRGKAPPPKQAPPPNKAPPKTIPNTEIRSSPTVSNYGTQMPSVKQPVGTRPVVPPRNPDRIPKPPLVVVSSATNSNTPKLQGNNYQNPGSTVVENGVSFCNEPKRPPPPNIPITKATPVVTPSPVKAEGPPPPPPPMPADEVTTMDLPEMTSSRSSLLEQIRQPHTLKKTEPRANTPARTDSLNTASQSMQGMTTNVQFADALKKALDSRALRTQSSFDDRHEEDSWDSD